MPEQSQQIASSACSSQAININMRVTANSNQGHRKYMEDCYKIKFQRENQDSDTSEILFSYFGIFDGHGGKEAAQFAKENLYWKIIELDDFWSDDDERVLKAINDGFAACHMDMWNELDNWSKTPSGLPSTSGCTATVLFIKKNKAYVGHVGDSGILIGLSNDSHHKSTWTGKKLTKDHKPEDPIELERIHRAGGQVVNKGGVNRVVWNRPVHSVVGEKRYEKIPFLAVARSLGDLWSYNYENDEFTVSPVPDCFTFDIDPNIHKCIVLATDGLWNVLKPNETVEYIRQTDMETESLVNKRRSTTSGKSEAQPFINPSQRLVNVAVQRCSEKMLRADNTTCITIMIDNPGKCLTDNLLTSEDTLSDSQCLVEEDLCSTRISEYATPISRSRSLVSLRRRHWSGGSESRTKSSVKIQQHQQQQQPVNEFITKKKLFSQSVQNIRSSSRPEINDHNMKTTSDSGLIANKNQNNKENHEKANDTTSTATNAKKVKRNFYRQRLLILKNRLIKTKNCLFRRKRKSFNVRRSTEKSLLRSARKKSTLAWQEESTINKPIKRLSSQHDFLDYENQRSCKKTRYI